MMQLTLSCVVFVAVLFLHSQHAKAELEPEPPKVSVDYVAGDAIEDDNSKGVDDDSKEAGEFYRLSNNTHATWYLDAHNFYTNIMCAIVLV